MRNIYIAGPMTGRPLFNFPAFDAADADLSAQGWRVHNPAEITRRLWFRRYGEVFNPENTDPRIAAGGDIYEEFLREDVRTLAECNAVALLPGWEKSKGVARELAVAGALGLNVYDYNHPDTGRRQLTPVVAATATPDLASKPSNPKDIVGSGKLPLHLWPSTATALGCLAFLEGALKYGRSNFREVGVRASIYVDAAKRHLDAWFEGEECAPDSGLPHLANALACVAIIVDAQAAGKLADDRNITGGYRALVESITPHVERLKQLHADKSPKHYTIADTPKEAA